VKQHDDRSGTSASLPADRTLFVALLDPFVTEAALERCFSAFGDVESVRVKLTDKGSKGTLGKEEDGRSVALLAHIVFEEPQGVQAVLANATHCSSDDREGGGQVPHDHEMVVLGLPESSVAGWIVSAFAAYRDPRSLQKEVDTYMDEYDIQKEAERLMQNGDETITDEEGFTLVRGRSVKAPDGTVIHKAKSSAPQPAVGRGGSLFQRALGPTASATSGEGSRKSAVKKRKKRERREEAMDFYRFQMREKRRTELADARRQKEADVSKIEGMRKAKRFKITE